MLKNQPLHSPAQSFSPDLRRTHQLSPKPAGSHPPNLSHCPNCHDCSSSHPHPSEHQSNHPVIQQSTNPIPPERSEHAHPNNPVIQQSNNPLPAITVGGLADLLGCGRLEIRDYAARLGLRFIAKRVGARRKPVACLSGADAETLIAAYQADLAAGPLPPEPEPVDPDLGFVYLLQLEPDYDPGRFKIGFSSAVYRRLCLPLKRPLPA